MSRTWSNISPRRRRALWAMLVLIILTLAFIWGNSLLSRETSLQASSFVEAYIRPVLHALLGFLLAPSAIDAINIRKLAHFFEFFVLGVEITCLWYLLQPVRKLSVLWPIFLPLLVAGVDESLQIVSSRGPSLFDVGIDWLGALTGVFITMLLRTLLLRCNAHRRENNA